MTKLSPNFIQTGGCISEKKLSREVCSGSCGSSDTNYIRFAGLMNNAKLCKCCSADKTYTETVKMNCPETGLVVAEYVRIVSCKCEICGGTPSF